MQKKQSKKQVPPSDDDEEESPALSPVDSEEEEDSVYDSEDGLHHEDANDDSDDDDDDDEEDDFEDQGSSDDDDERLEEQEKEAESDEDVALAYEKEPRSWKASAASKRGREGKGKPSAKATGTEKSATWMHTDDWSSDEDDPEGTGNRIGRVPLHWYDEYDHVGYSVDGQKIGKASGAGDRLDQAIAMQDNMAQGKFEVYDALNDRTVQLTSRQLELIRRVQAGAFAHPEHDAYPDYIDYFSGVDKEVSGLHSDTYEKKSRFQPNQYEKMMVDKLGENCARCGKLIVFPTSEFR